jgi:hypothetical protein
VELREPRFPLPLPVLRATAAPTMAAPAATPAVVPHPAPLVGLAGGGGGSVPIINGDPGSGDDKGFASDDEELSILRPPLGGVTSGVDMPIPPALAREVS